MDHKFVSFQYRTTFLSFIYVYLSFLIYKPGSSPSCRSAAGMQCRRLWTGWWRRRIKWWRRRKTDIVRVKVEIESGQIKSDFYFFLCYVPRLWEIEANHDDIVKFINKAATYVSLFFIYIYIIHLLFITHDVFFSRWWTVLASNCETEMHKTAVHFLRSCGRASEPSDCAADVLAMRRVTNNFACCWEG